MKVLIVAATQAELALTYQYFNLVAQDFVEQPKFDILVTGVGMTATAFALGRYLNNNNYNLVLNVGIAGSFDRRIELGTLVSIEQDTFAELGAEDQEQFIDLQTLGFGQSTFHATYEIPQLLKVKGITVNKVHGHAPSIATVSKRLAPQSESMEGAAVFYACNKLQLPCAQVRSISNFVEPRAKENWKIGLAIKNLNDWLIDFIVTVTK